MLRLHHSAITVSRKVFLPAKGQNRTFWEYVNMMFNKPDPDRIKLVGPDRACAEWVLRNGGKIVWENGVAIADYNSLPPEYKKVPRIKEIDGTDSAISHYGFEHLVGCTGIEKIILHNGSYIENRAIKGLEYSKDSLRYLQVSNCTDVNDDGIKQIQALNNLRSLILFSLPSVDNLDECITFLRSKLPQCDVKGK